MTEFSMLPWETQTATGDGAAPYTQAQANEFFRLFDVQDPSVEGVAKGVMNELAVSGSASPLSVDSGAAICYGRYWNDAVVQLSVSTPSVGTTGGRVVLRCDWSANTIRLVVKINTDGVSALPALSQVFGATWEIGLASFTITTAGVITLTDTRTFRRPTSLIRTDDMVNDAVDDTKAGDRVPQFYRRQGGNALGWDTPGGTGFSANYTPGAVRMQAGAWSESGVPAGSYKNVPITFPVAFQYAPMIFVTTTLTSPETPLIYYIVLSGASGFDVLIYNDSASSTTVEFNWLAIGPE